MSRKFKLFLLVLIQVTIVLSTQVPLLYYTGGRWKLSEIARSKLSVFNDKKVHVIAINGPTRMGKSYTMSHLLQKVDTVHFGTFIHGNDDVPVTKGIDIALVEHRGNFVLFLDCEGSNDVQHPMDPKLMVIMSMISQKVLYLNARRTVDANTISDIGTMLHHLNIVSTTETSRLPMDTLMVILNQSRLSDAFRDTSFISTHLQDRNLYDKYFANQKLLFIGLQLPHGSPVNFNFQRDIDTLFNTLMERVNHFHLGGVELSIQHFLTYLENNVLPAVNGNEQIVVQSLIQKKLENDANRILDKIRPNIPICIEYCDANELECKLCVITNQKKEFRTTCAVFKHLIEDVHKKCLTEFDDCYKKFEQKNTELGKKTKQTITREIVTEISREEEEEKRCMLLYNLYGSVKPLTVYVKIKYHVEEEITITLYNGKKKIETKSKGSREKEETYIKKNNLFF